MFRNETDYADDVDDNDHDVSSARDIVSYFDSKMNYII